MFAATYSDFHGAIQIKDLPIPKLPPDGAIIEIKATGICRSDWHG